jgi:hypothetical protein
MSGDQSSGRKSGGDRGADDTSGTGNSGTGADSALEAMLKKRQMTVNPAPDPAGPPAAQPQDGKVNGR